MKARLFQMDASICELDRLMKELKPEWVDIRFLSDDGDEVNKMDQLRAHSRLTVKGMSPGRQLKADLLGEGDAKYRLPISTERFFFIERDMELDDMDDVLWDPMPVGFHEFIAASPGQLIPNDAVKMIKLEQLDSNALRRRRSC